MRTRDRSRDSGGDLYAPPNFHRYEKLSMPRNNRCANLNFEAVRCRGSQLLMARDGVLWRFLAPYRPGLSTHLSIALLRVIDPNRTIGSAINLEMKDIE